MSNPPVELADLEQDRSRLYGDFSGQVLDLTGLRGDLFGLLCVLGAQHLVLGFELLFTICIRHA